MTFKGLKPGQRVRVWTLGGSSDGALLELDTSGVLIEITLTSPSPEWTGDRLHEFIPWEQVTGLVWEPKEGGA